MSQQLFLASAGLRGLSEWVERQHLRRLRALLIPTAARPLADRSFVDAVAAELERIGATVRVLDLADVDNGEAYRTRVDAELVVVAGGYAIYLLQHVRRSGFGDVLSDSVRSGACAYVGVSAGAALVRPDLTPFQSGEDPGQVRSYRGLGLVPFTVLPHRNRGRAQRHDGLPVSRGRYVSINDDQAIAVSGATWHVTDSPE